MIVFKILIFLGIRGLILFIGRSLNKKIVSSKFQGSPFECGINVLEFSEVPMRLRFFMLTVVFLIFDVELVLLIPFFIYFFQGVRVFISLMFIIFLLSLVFGVFIE